MQPSVTYGLFPYNAGNVGNGMAPKDVNFSSLNVFDDGDVLLRSILWTLPIVSMFCNHKSTDRG
jgi:hypothetical protein